MSAARERGSAAVDSLFAIIFVLVFALGVIQIAQFLYARNVVMSAAHEGARAAVEHGRDAGAAEGIAAAAIRRAAGGLVRDLRIRIALREMPSAEVRVEIRAATRRIGPLPVSLPLHAEATARRDVVVP